MTSIGESAQAAKKEADRARLARIAALLAEQRAAMRAERQAAVPAPRDHTKRQRQRIDTPPAAIDASPEETAAKHAATLLHAAKNLERMGKSAGALEFYHRIVHDSPDSPEAKTATARITVLGSR